MLPIFTNRLGDREAAEGALERNLLANKFIILFALERSFSTIRFVTHNLQRTAILKLPEAGSLSPPRHCGTVSKGRGEGEGDLYFDFFGSMR
jgi:hypothetical protein